MLSGLLRRTVLVAAHEPTVAGIMRRYGMRLGARRFVAGETLDETIAALKALRRNGLQGSTTLLGEAVTDARRVAEVVAEYEAILHRIAEERLEASVALKLTNVGLAFDEALALENAARLATRAAEIDSVLRIDMEESHYVGATLRTYRQLRGSGHENLELALQAYLRRSGDDLRALLALRPNVRLVKGAYLEPPAVAFPEKRDVDQKYVELMELSLREGGYTAIATHDERIIEDAIRFTEREGIGRARFEFQMLYGIRSQLQLALARRGYRVLVSVPFGPQWYPYLMRRLAERPANLVFFLVNLFRR